MKQTKLNSILESIVNIIIGYITAVWAQIVIYPMFNIDVPLSTNLQIGVWFTFVSLVRTYILRRCFNSLKNFHFCFKTFRIKSDEANNINIREVIGYISAVLKYTYKDQGRIMDYNKMVSDLMHVFELSKPQAERYITIAMFEETQNLYKDLNHSIDYVIKLKKIS